MRKTIAVAGKGGTGKSTIAAMTIQGLLERKSGTILAVDADPDSNLAALLGLSIEKSIGELREELLKDIKNFPAGMTKANYIESGLHQIIEESEGFDLITMGKGEGSGCYCYLNNLIKKFVDDLAPNYPWTVIDNEAGLEHLSRRTTSDIDALLIVVNDNPLSFAAAERIIEITDEMGGRVRKRYIVTNMAKERRMPEIRQWVRGLGLGLLAEVPYDEELEEIVYKGKPVSSLAGSPVKDCIESIISRISN